MNITNYFILNKIPLNGTIGKYRIERYYANWRYFIDIKFDDKHLSFYGSILMGDFTSVEGMEEFVRFCKIENFLRCE